MTRERGFTLLEVLVALAILASALAAAIRAGGAATLVVGDLRQRLLAGWVAENRAAELRALRLWPSPGESGGEALMAGDRLIWRQTVTQTINSRFRRVEIKVAPAGAPDSSAASLIVYFDQP